jgi:serine/threonine protein kinase/predicted Zn-dependent protease
MTQPPLPDTPPDAASGPAPSADHRPAAGTFPHTPGYEIHRELGRGGMGVVYEARQLSLNRKVALKVLSGRLGLTPQAVQRFRREAEAAARLHHTNIVPVYATGEQDGLHYYVMELIDGPSLDQVLGKLRQTKGGAAATPEAPALTTAYVAGPDASGPASGLTHSSSVGSGGAYFDTAARTIADVADALEYAHRQGVIHRDVKPSNLLLGPDGRLSLNDFGLARVLEQPGMTQTGEFVGTPRYMSPEQITGGRVPVDHRTDVYSLGATLYELLTMQPPFTGVRRDQVLAQVLQKEPRPPRRLNRSVPVDLETICLKALEKDPDRRYQTAGQMAEDLRRYVNRFAIAARRVGPLGRMRKWVRRHPALAATLALALLLAGAAGFFAYQSHAGEQRRLAEQKQADERLLAEHRQNALDKGMVAAMSQDWDGAEKAVAEAERLGASAGQVYILRGFIAIYHGKAADAVKPLEQAVALMPDSVAARALLALAYGFNGQMEASDRARTELQDLTPETPEDYLFMGLMQVRRDPERGLKYLDEAVRRRPSLVAYSFRGDARLNWADDTGDPAEAELAMEDAEAVKQFLPDDPLALLESVEARLAAASAYAAAGQPNKREAVLAQAAREVEVLTHHDDYPIAVTLLWMYYRYVNDEESLLKTCRHAWERTHEPLVAMRYAQALYRHGDPDKALEILDTKRGSALDMLRPFVLAELPDGSARALEAYKEMAARHYLGEYAEYNSAVLCFLGRRKEAVAQEVDHEAPRSWPEPLRAFFRQVQEYKCGRASADELFKAAGASRKNQCNAHYFVALTELADGNRDGARDHFRKAVELRTLEQGTADMSWIFLGRMERDPAWPPWIPANK